LNTWQAFFDYLTRYVDKNGMVLVFDELPYIHKTNPNFISILQFFWDEKWKNMNLKLILCGSSISMMQKITLSYSSPIYGRRTGQIDLQPLTYLDFRNLFNEWDEEDIIGAYSVLGGIPRYAEEFDKKEGLQDFANYFSILKAVAFGKNTFNEISDFSGVFIPTLLLSRSENLISFLIS
jgi:AAA+ ATPase superfamily predicted ATPase